MSYKKLTWKQEFDLLPRIMKNYADAYLYMHETNKDADILDVRLPFHSKYLMKPELSKRVLVDNYANYPKSYLYNSFKPMLGEGMVTSHGESWKRQRRMVSPALRQSRISGMLPVIVNNTNRLIENWKSLENQTHEDARHDIMGLTLDIFCGILFGEALREKGRQIGDQQLYCFGIATEKNMNLLSAPYWIPTPANRKFKRSLKIVDDICMEFIQKARDGKIGDEYLLTKMVNAVDEVDGTKMSTQQILDEVKTLVFAGYDTTSLAISWTIYELSRRPEILKRIQSEVDQVFSQGEPNPEMLGQLSYTRKVVSESLRLHPSVPGISRDALGDDEIGGIKINKGDLITIPIFLFHHSEEHWDKPFEFNPDRFENPPESKFAYMPFITGPRFCVGEHLAWLELTWIVASLVHNFDFEYLSDKEMESYPIATMRLKDPLQLRVKPRSPKKFERPDNHADRSTESRPSL